MDQVKRTSRLIQSWLSSEQTNQTGLLRRIQARFGNDAMSYSALNRIVRGQREDIGAKEVEQLETVTGLTLTVKRRTLTQSDSGHLLELAGRLPEVPVITLNSDDGYDLGISSGYTFTAPVLMDSHEKGNVYAVTLTTNPFKPYRSGDIVFFDTSTIPKSGDEVVVNFGNEGHLCRVEDKNGNLSFCNDEIRTLEEHAEVLGVIFARTESRPQRDRKLTR